MSLTSKLTAKNQTTIPKAVVEALQIKRAVRADLRNRAGRACPAEFQVRDI
ncbi:MAG TPA: hypothetical protein PK992_18580 [Planctomycetaceae bacterium]|nr:hypothetical protein [Planctomycetaceae bacterium]